MIKYTFFKVNKLYEHYFKRYGLWFVLLHYFKIKKQQKCLEDISSKWNTKVFQMYMKSPNPRSFSYTTIATLCSEWDNRKPQNYQNQLRNIFKSTIKD